MNIIAILILLISYDCASMAICAPSDRVMHHKTGILIFYVCYTQWMHASKVYKGKREGLFSFLPVGLVHWESNRADIPSFEDYYRIHSPAIQVEITAYALLSYLAYHQLSDAISYSSPIVKWLIQQQNPYGGFSSTQVNCD